MSEASRLFVVIPAAGRSRRMGTHKLLLEFDGETLIRRLIRQLQEASDLHSIHLLVREDDEALLKELRRVADVDLRPGFVRWPSKAVERQGSTALEGHRTGLRSFAAHRTPSPACIEKTPIDTLDMKSSVSLLLQRLQQRHGFAVNDRWLLIPADHPVVHRDVLAQVIAMSLQFPDTIVVPVTNGKRGHPTTFPGKAVDLLNQIPEDRGLNWLLRNTSLSVKEVDVNDPSIHWDLDTPDDVERFRKLLQFAQDPNRPN